MILRPTTASDCRTLGQSLRACDRKEIALGSGNDPTTVLFNAWRASVICDTIETSDRQIAGIWGIVPLPRNAGSIWMLGSPALEDIPTSFLRESRRTIASVSKSFPTLLCAPWRGNELHLRWLRWLGFTLDDPGGHFLQASRHV